MDEKTTALVLKAADYNENDKMLSLYCAETGKFTAVIRGVKKAGAKLKFAAEPFCFGEFLFAEKNGYRVVTNCNEIESFYSLRTDYGVFERASIVLDLLNTFGQENDENPQLFLCSLRALQTFQLQELDPTQTLVKFLLDACRCLGVNIELNKCVLCGNEHATRYGFDERAGGIVCPSCFSLNTLSADAAVLKCLQLIINTPGDRQHTLKFGKETLLGALKLIGQYCQGKFGKLKSLSIL